MAVVVIKVIYLLILYCTSLISANNLLNCGYHHKCLCPEDVLTFTCSVSDGAATVWKGSIFNCPISGNEIVLRHSRFEGGVDGTCNSEAVVAYSTEVTNNSYTSQLNVTVRTEMHNGTIECIQDGLNEASVRACTLYLARAEIPDDINIEFHVSDINTKQFTIEWSQPASYCPIVAYDIATTNCGVCPNTTFNTFITCTNLMVDGRVCSVVIHTMACENSPELSDVANLTILLRVPSTPNVMARWTNLLSSILTNFNETEQFFISDGIDGSATSYTITYYSDSTSGRICDSATILASECTIGQCSHTFFVPLICSNITSIVITVFATNVLGDGPSSEPVILEFSKNFTHNEGTSDSTILYSIVGGSFFAVLLPLILIIIVLASILKKVYTSFQRPIPKNSPVTIEPIAVSLSDEMEPIGMHNLVQTVLDEDKVTENSEVTEEHNIYENDYHEIDKALNLDKLLIQIRDQVTPKWYQFGLAVGISKEILDEFSSFSPEECIVEILDLWLRTNETTVTWRDVADALKKIGCHRLAERILKVYKTGILPEGAAMPAEESSIVSESDDQDSTSELSNQPDQPPLPSRMYQSTS